jgi:hypothetical protein
MALVERGSKVRSSHFPEVAATTLKPIIVDAIAKESHFGTDESRIYWVIGEQFATIARSLINQRVRSRECAREYSRGLLLDLQALRLRRLSPPEPGTFKALSL